MASFAVSTPNKAASPPDFSSPLSSPPPSSVTNRLLDYSPEPSPSAHQDDCSPISLEPTTPPAFQSSPPRHPSPSPSSTEQNGGRPQNTPPGQQQGHANEPSGPDEPHSPPAATSRPVTTTRSGRRVVRKRPAEDAPAEDRTPAKASPSAAAKSKRIKREAARWQPASVLSNKRSPLANFDIRALLCKPEAWTVLSKDEQAAVLALFPRTTATPAQGGADDAAADDAAADGMPPPVIAALANDDNFRHDCARFRSDLAAGFFDNAWLADAFAAHAQRARGVFDAYVVEAFETNWGIPLPDAYRAGWGAEPAQERTGGDAVPVCDAGLPHAQEKGDEDEANGHHSHEKNGAGAVKPDTEHTEPSAQETVVPSDEPVKEVEVEAKAPEEPPDAANAEAAETDAGPPRSENAKDTPAPDETAPAVPAKQPPARATADRRGSAKTTPDKAKRPARRAPRSTPAAKPEKKVPGRAAKRQKQAEPGPGPATEKDKAATAAASAASAVSAASAFDWDFPGDEDEAGTQKTTAIAATPPVRLGDALPASPEAATDPETAADTDTDSDAGTDADADWKPARKPARRGPRAAAKRRASSTVAVRQRKKKTSPSTVDDGSDC